MLKIARFMKLKHNPVTKRLLTVRAITAFVAFASFPALAQSAKPQAPPAKSQAAQPAAALAIEEKAEKILAQAVAALGGSAYLNVRSSLGRGLFTPFREGVSGLPSTFVDYIVYPDKERTEFKGGGAKTIQTNTGETGWIYDGAAKTIKEMTPAQVADFRLAMRTNVDNLLRGLWRTERAQVTYAGRREAGLAKRNETVRVTYPDGLVVDFEFGAKDGLPAKTSYKHTNSEGEELTEEDRLAQFVTNAGVTSPFVIDHFTGGTQTSRINYQSIEYNAQFPDTLFARPASVKAVK